MLNLRMQTTILSLLPSYVFLHIFVQVLNITLKLFVNLLYGLPCGQFNRIFLRLKLVLFLFGPYELLFQLHNSFLKVFHNSVNPLLIRAS
jgi:hypothetical protein